MSDSATQASPPHIDVELLITYLKQQQSKGETHVHLDEQAKLILREFYLRAKGLKPNLASNTPAPIHTSSTTSTTTAASPQAQPTTPTKIVTKGSDSQSKIQSLKDHALASAEIKQLKTLRETLVFSAGNPKADIMLIGDAPGYHEEKQQSPFAGPAGQKLDGILKAMGLTRDQVYLTYLVKFRPMMENQTTNNRKPSAKEINAFTPYIEQEIKAVAPKVIITLGSLASTVLLQTNKPIDEIRGESHKIHNITTRATYHPSYLLSNDSNSDKRKLWEDMLAVMTDLGMPISERQQNYFKTP